MIQHDVPCPVEGTMINDVIVDAAEVLVSVHPNAAVITVGAYPESVSYGLKVEDGQIIVDKILHAT